jgi:hypothetical protein
MRVTILFLFATLSVVIAGGKCPLYQDIMDKKSLANFEEVKYQGEWYQVADTEPTEPSFCGCDRFTWLINPKKKNQFYAPFRSVCTVMGKALNITITMSGERAKDPMFQGLRSEGLPPLIPFYPNMVLYVERDPQVRSMTGYEYTMALVYTCGKTLPLLPAFQSIQLFSRVPNPGKDKIDAILAKGRSLGLKFDDKKMIRRRQGGSCIYPPSDLPVDFTPH